MFLDKKTLLKIWLTPGLNLTIFRRTGPRVADTTSLGLLGIDQSARQKYRKVPILVYTS